MKPALRWAAVSSATVLLTARQRFPRSTTFLFLVARDQVCSLFAAASHRYGVQGTVRELIPTRDLRLFDGFLAGHLACDVGTFSRKAFHEVMDVNALAPLMVSEALRDNVLASVQKKIVAIAGRFVQGPYYYRMSKAALNMGIQALGADLKSQGVIAASVSPGIADTDMVAQFYRDYPASRRNAALPVAQSVAQMISVIDKLDQAKAARGVNNFDGTIIPW